MLARKALAGTAGTPKAYVEEVFSTYLYAGNGTGKAIKNDIKLGASYSGTTLKLNFDSNNTDSANSFTPTVTGTAGYSTADAKFGAGSCAGFDAASWLDYNPEAGNFGSGDWTVEFWVKTSSGNGPGIVTQAFAAGAANTSWGFFVGYGTSGNIAFYLSDGSSYFASITSGTTAVNNNTWNHVAACRSGSTVYLFLNGVSQGTASVGTTALGNGGAPVRIGGQGTSYSMPSGTYIDDVRIIKGTALYTSGFTPPSAATNTTSYPPTTTAGEGGLVWTKRRNDTNVHQLTDTARGVSYQLDSASTAAQSNEFNRLSSFNSDGFSVSSGSDVNSSAGTYTSWTFRKAKKFFDVVTYTGNGTARTISHNLGSVPGCIIVKSSSANDDWKVYHRSLTSNAYYLRLNATSAETNAVDLWNNTTPTSTEFSISASGNINTNGSTYVAYLFAHDAGGFGDAGSDSIIKCGSTTTDGSGNSTVTLDWEPQFVMIKRSSGTGDWFIFDNMRKFANVGSSGDGAAVWANLGSAEADGYNIRPTATGFTYGRDASSTYIYIAIRRGPMKTPTTGTSVFAPVTLAANGSTNSTLVSTGFPVDLQIGPSSSDGSNGCRVHDRLRGGGKRLYTDSTSFEDNSSVSFDFMTGMKQQQTNGTPTWYLWRRAPGFLDVVCYTGTGSNLTVAHNLGVVPELIIAKNRTTVSNWPVLFNFTSTNSSYAFLNLSSAGGNDTYANVGVMTAQPTSTNLLLSSSGSMNTSGNGHVAYLFASVSGVSKVGTYTGNGSSVTVTTDFQPRFIMVKRTNSTGDWIVSDSARGLVAGNDPYIEFNTADAEVTNEDWVDVSSTGFTVNQTTNNANVNTGTYIYLAIA